MGHGHCPVRALCLRMHRKGGKGRGFGEQRAETPPKPTPGALMEADKRWKLDAYDRAEWEAWLQDQKQSAGVKGNNLYLQVCPSSGGWRLPSSAVVVPTLCRFHWWLTSRVWRQRLQACLPGSSGCCGDVVLLQHFLSVNEHGSSLTTWTSTEVGHGVYRCS